MRSEFLSDLDNPLIFELILESTVDIIVAFDPNYQVLLFSKSAQKIYKTLRGIDLKIGLKLDEIVVQENRAKLLETTEKALKGEVQIFEYFNVSSITSRWLEYKIEPIYKKDSVVGVLWVISDIHEKKMKEIEIQNYLTRFKEIAWKHAHEVRGPLSTLESLLILMKAEKSLGENEVYLDYLDKAFQKFELIIKDIMSLSNENEQPKFKV